MCDDGTGTPKEKDVSETGVDKVAEAKYLLNTMMYYRKLCDDKASILLAIFGAVVTAIIMIGGQQIAELFSSLTEDSSMFGYLLVALIIASIFVLVTGIFLLICTVNPYTGTKIGKGKTEEESHSILYFRGIVENNCVDFKKKYDGYGNKEYVDDVLSEAYITAEVCVKKYKQLYWGLFLSAAGIAAFAAFVVIGFIIA